ncbi:uncharacterized protein LOC116298059 [Actinia tenebrosa]|uniref:Uncharacterized protein LOC116298059 n=1 Tax=Actinia tenebrosa TaxID=6105 RepID=A0A6P8IBP4_ACTTE|nr:uncharacterized protein LOC116298059 [Actinia tenebrosa]
METENLEEDLSRGKLLTPTTNKFVSTIFNLHFCQRTSRECVSDILEAIGDFCTTKEIYQRFLLTGGLGEGMVWSKDIDFMLLDTSITVKQEESGDIETQGFELLSMTDQIKPGFAKLSVVNPESFPFMDCARIVNGKYYLSSFLFIQKQAQTVSEASNAEGTHGPAVLIGKASEVHTENDVVSTLKSPQWPHNVFQAFKTRVLHWLSYEMVSQIEKNGCYYVPIGDPTSPEKDLEWRLSFSLIEKSLIRTLNSVQYNCYTFLKLLGEILHSYKEQKLLCSYFFKTALFWSIEEEDKSFWEESNVLNCIAFVLKKMSLFFQTHNFPNYFIPENNMIAHLNADKCCQLAEELACITKDLLYTVFCSLPLGIKGEYDSVFERLNLKDTEDRLASKETRDGLYRDVVTTLEALDSCQIQDLMEAGIANISSSTSLYQKKYRRDIRNDLQNFLDPNFFDLFDFFPRGCSLETKIDALMAVIANISNVVKEANFCLCYKQALYRALGNICHIEALYTKDEDRKTTLLEDAESYYKNGLELVFPDGFDDQMLSSKVYLAQFHYMNNNLGKAAQVLDEVEEILNDEDLVMEIGDACICTEICVPEHLEALKHDQGLYEYFNGLSLKDSKFINSVALAYYMRLKCYQVSQPRTDKASTLLHLKTELIQNRNSREVKVNEDAFSNERYQKLFMQFEKFCTSYNETPSHSVIDRILRDSSMVLLGIVRNQ